ncbi:hypothetical protein B5V89_14795, partial [Heyndrickxia sporothermodurans]|uniref:phage tail spike protein n=1 Tax=Heyndrickxia sporothermodurans TaxID=46224 RepID=UPI000D40FDA7
MFPILYKKDETDFIHNGLGVLSGAITSIGEEELNGLFELKIEYDSDGFLADIIENGMIVKAKVNDKQDPQLFRIYAHVKSLENDNLIINAQHITYDLAGNFVEALELDDVSTDQAMAAIQSNLAYPTRFTLSSSNTTTRSSTKLYRTNPLQMVAGVDGSILDNWGGEIERDNFNLIMHKRRGSDDGVSISYRKNLTGLEAKFDISGVVTRIFPFKIIKDGETEEEKLITIPNKYIDSPNIDKYPFINILPVDYGDDESVVDQATLLAKASTYFNTGSKDLPKVSMEVEFEPLWDTEEYKDVAALERVGMGDTVTVRHSKMGVDVKAHVVKIEYDTIAEKNRKVTIGDVQARFTDNFNQTKNDVENGIKQAHQTAQEAIQAANGKNTNFYGPEQPVNPKKDDLWFKTVDGEYTRTYRFDGIQWQLVVDMDVNSAKEEAQKARDDAQSAVDRANKATQDAQIAINNAQSAFEDAQEALQQAKESFDAVDALSTVVNTQTGEISTIKQTAQGLQTQVTDNKNNIAAVTLTAQGLQARMSSAEGNIGALQLTSNNFATRISDAEGNISTLTQTTSSLSSTINNTKDNLQSQISQLDKNINLRVQKGDVINQINLDTSGVLIQGKKLVLDGDVTVTGAFKVSDANITSIDAGKINAGTLTAFDIVGSTIRGSTFTAEDKLTNNTISISTGSIDSQGESQKDKTKKYFARLNGGVFSSEIKTSNTQVDGYNKVTIQPDLILFEAGDSYGSGSPYKKSNFSISSGKAAGKLDMYIQAFGVDSPNLRLLASDDIILSSGPPSVIDLNGLLVRRGYDELLTLYDRKTYKDGGYTDPVAKVRADIVGDLMAPTDGGDAYARTNFEFRVTDKASQGKATQNYRDIRARDLYLTKGIEMGSKGVISTSSGYIVVRSRLDDYVYLQAKEVRATEPLTASSYIPVRASSFPTGSLEEFKQDIKLWQDSALAIINAAD